MSRFFAHPSLIRATTPTPRNHIDTNILAATTISVTHKPQAPRLAVPALTRSRILFPPATCVTSKWLLSLSHLPPLDTNSTSLVSDTMPRRIKEPALPAGPPLDASLLGIPPELRNAIYHAVADDIDKVSIIGRRLDQSKATSRDDSWLWNAMAKHPLSQTCGQLRREFDPIHQHRAITTGVTRYRLELENFDVERISDFAGVIRFMPKVITVQLRETVIFITVQLFDAI